MSSSDRFHKGCCSPGAEMPLRRSLMALAVQRGAYLKVFESLSCAVATPTPYGHRGTYMRSLSNGVVDNKPIRDHYLQYSALDSRAVWTLGFRVRRTWPTLDIRWSIAEASSRGA